MIALLAVAWFGAFQDTPISSIRITDGEVRSFIERQRDGLGTHYAVSGYPYDTCMWTGVVPQPEYMPSWRARWWPYEQAGYLVDGLGRVGIYLDDPRLKKLLADSVEYAVTTRNKAGLFGNDDTDPWANAVFARAMMAQYELTGDKRILDALAANSLAVTNAEGRAMCTAEADLFLYRKTGDEKWIEQLKAHTAKYPWPWRQLSRPRQIWDPIESHGVTAAEEGKLPCLYYLVTGDKQQLKDSVTFFEQVMHFNELADGVPSSEEGYGGNADKTQSPKDKPLWDHGGLMIHETCDITDQMWTFGYLLMATGDAVWADRIERIFFNAAPAAVTEDFKAVQYFSSPNQVFASRNTGHPGFGEVGLTRQAYRPGCDTECCAGNVHRMAPAYIARMWMLDRSGHNPAAMLYGNSEFAFVAENGAKVKIREEGNYPWSGGIKFVATSDKPTRFVLYYRMPAWANDGKAEMRSVEVEIGAGETWSHGIMIPMRLRQERHSGGISLYRGPILFALPISANDEVVTEGEEKCSKECPAHYLTPARPWNYAMPVFPNVSDSTDFQISYSGRKSRPSVFVTVPLFRRTDWVPETGYNAERTPWVPAPKPVGAEKVELQRLVPIGETTLRISVFPIAE